MSRHRAPRKVMITSEQAHPDSHGCTVSTWHESLKKRDLLKIVADWWDSYGSHLDDFDTIHIKFLSETENKNVKCG